jgi:hypothetical protein
MLDYLKIDFAAFVERVNGPRRSFAMAKPRLSSACGVTSRS